jgi:transcriptional regulator with PAS, ATPase and Fis domain
VLKRDFHFRDMVSKNPAMHRVFDLARSAAKSQSTILILGESGTGKELVAAAIHDRSPRKRARFVAQNLAALPPELMSSELFGHVKGSFTGAHQARRGLFELADGGTLFLDEIGEAPAPLQAMLLRALETREFWPVGASEPRRVDVRIIAATNRDLLADAQSGGFRLDLYYRLAVAPIRIPPLRERPEDVRLLGAPMLEAAARRMGRPLPRMSDAAWAALERHAWPGNVRELSNLMERVAIYSAGKEVHAEDLGLPAVDVRSSRFPPAPESMQGLFGRPASVPPPSTRGADVIGATPITLTVPDGGTTFDDLERDILVQVLQKAEGNQSRAARTLGLSESTFRSRLKRLGLKG